MVWYKNYIYIHPKAVNHLNIYSAWMSIDITHHFFCSGWGFRNAIMNHASSRSALYIIINYYKSTESILPAIYFPNLQQENPLYILNLFEGNVTLDIQKKCVGYNLSNSRHFHDISQVIVSHTLIHHDPSWVHQKFRTRGFSPGPEYVAWDSETVALQKKTSYFTKLFWSPWHVGSAFFLCRANIGRSLAPIEFGSLCCFLLLKTTKTSNGPFLKTQMTHTVQQKPFRTYLRCASLFTKHLQSHWVTINLPKG